MSEVGVERGTPQAADHSGEHDGPRCCDHVSMQCANDLEARKWRKHSPSLAVGWRLEKYFGIPPESWEREESKNDVVVSKSTTVDLSGSKFNEESADEDAA